MLDGELAVERTDAVLEIGEVVLQGAGGGDLDDQPSVAQLGGDREATCAAALEDLCDEEVRGGFDLRSESLGGHRAHDDRDPALFGEGVEGRCEPLVDEYGGVDAAPELAQVVQRAPQLGLCRVDAPGCPWAELIPQQP